MKNLVIVPAGDNSLHTKWDEDEKNYDLIVLYYGSNEDIFNEYKKNSKDCVKVSGHKWHLISKYILSNLKEIEKYDYVWFPDDDLLSNVKDINNLFEINKEYSLWLSQPSLSGYVAYEIEKKVDNSLLRFTNFVEIICPLMSIETLKKLVFYFNINESAWGLDYLWPKLLGYPKDKIAIIDNVTVEHTRPIRGDYNNRFKKEPMQELKEVFQKYNLSFNQTIFSNIPL
jgi:hypothetical protein